MAERTTIVLADDHPLYRSGLAGLVSVSEDLVIVGEASDGVEAVELVGRLRPDVAVLDLNMPRLHGLDAARRVREVSPGTGVIVLTMDHEDTTVFRALEAGVRGYVVKTDPPASVLHAIRSVAQGEAVFSPVLAGRMAAWFAGLGGAAGPVDQLTPREREVLALMAHGRDTEAIAAALDVSPKTVRNVVSNVLTKLRVNDRRQAVAKARAAGLV